MAAFIFIDVCFTFVIYFFAPLLLLLFIEYIWSFLGNEYRVWQAFYLLLFVTVRKICFSLSSTVIVQTIMSSACPLAGPSM